MKENVLVRARVNEDVKDTAAEVLAGLGLTVSDVVRMTLVRVAQDRALPFSLTPNARTRETLAKSDRDEDLHYPADAAALFKELGI